jgi:site-specific recombinase XerD/ribosomal protein L40E
VKLKDYVYNYDRLIERTLYKIKNFDLDEKNRQYLLDFYNECIVQTISKARIIKCLGTLLRVSNWLGKSFDEATKEDIIGLVRRIEDADYSNWTKHDYKAILKTFYKWLRKGEDYPPEVRWIRATARNMSKLPEELLSVEEVKLLVDKADTLRDKALLLVLYESGCRIGEILTLQLKHVQFDKFGAVILVNGKTGQRRVRLVVSAPKLMQWIDNHPLRDDLESALWVTVGTRKRNTPMTYAGTLCHLRKIVVRAGIRKRVYPHLFRHSRATHLANVLTEAQMKQYFGWVQHSDMASIYVHLSGRDVDSALLKMNGIAVSEENQDERLKALTCGRCKGSNSPDAKFCSNCGMCLDVKTAVEVDETRVKVDKLMTELVKRPEILEQMLHAVEAND